MQIRVPLPCTQPWSNMEGDDRVRHCAKCMHSVYNLSDMRHDDALALVRSRERRLCVRYYQRPDGTIVFADCDLHRAGKRTLHAAIASVAAALGVGISTHVPTCAAPSPAHEVGVTQAGVGPLPIDDEGLGRTIGIMGQVARTADIPPTPEWLIEGHKREPPPPPVHVSLRLRR